MMILNLSDISSESLQSQIIRQVRAQILNGSLLSGEDLPSIRKLSRDEKISVITVQRAYEALEREGLIYSRRGKGYFVSELSESKKQKMIRNNLSESITPFIKSALAEGISKNELVLVVKEILKKL